jgi:hypothetical protein
VLIRNPPGPNRPTDIDQNLHGLMRHCVDEVVRAEFE